VTHLYQLQLQWELGSPVFGFLLRKYAPHDTYQVPHPGRSQLSRCGSRSACRSVPDCCWHFDILRLDQTACMTALTDIGLSASCLADTSQVWKRGLRVRVDGSLVGVDKESAGMLPQWKRGGEQPRLAVAVLLLMGYPDGPSIPASGVL
jgi:hypothetical protein